ncbi:MAG: hypothetical protein AB9835_08400 [Eubacteriales bacterium]
MKRTVAAMTATILLLATMASCAGTPASSGDVKTGLGQNISIAKSKDAGEADGTAQVDTVMAAVSVDSSGKLTGVSIDSAQQKVAFDASGKITADLTAEQKTKKELGDAYGMKKASGIGKEWYEQINALEGWMKGKTLAEIKAMKTTTNEGKTLTDEADLKSSVTIDVSPYIAAVEEAVGNAK